MLRFTLFKILLIVSRESFTMGITSTDYWQEMDPNYDLSYLEPVDDIDTDTVIGCAMVSQRSNVTAFAYKASKRRCQMFNVDYYDEHIWTKEPGFDFFLRNEEIYPDPYNCLDESCDFCMPIPETRMTWSEADVYCDDLLELSADWIHRCAVMQLQYLRRPTSKRYWLGGTYDPLVADWMWTWDGSIGSSLWGQGEPDNPNTERCVLFVPGSQYTIRSANCSEKHYAVCSIWVELG